MADIYCVEHVSSRNSEDFEDRLYRAIQYWQSEGREVEIQYSASINQNSLVFSALVIAR